MAEEREMWTWDFVAWICFWMPRYTKRHPDLQVFHPVRGKLAQVERRGLRRSLEKLARTLPEHLTEAEIEARWAAFVEAGRGRK